MNLREWRWVVVAGVAVAIIGLAGCGGVGDPTSSGPSQSAGPTPSASPSTPEPSPPVAGAIPVPALPASAIPWDDVGPGWFLLSYDPDVSDDVQPENTDSPTGPQWWFDNADEALQLVSPAGDLYYARDLTDAGGVRALAWTGESVLVLEGHATADSGETPHGRFDSIDLATGAATTLNPNLSQFSRAPRMLADGRIVLWGAGEGQAGADVVSPSFAFDQSVCVVEGEAISTLSPDGTRVVCLEDEDYPKSAVMLYNLVDGSSAKIDTFSYGPVNYRMHGWWDANSFVVSRVDTGGTTLWWAYDVSTQTIRDLNATLSNGTAAEVAEGVAGYRVVSAGTTVEVQGFDGTLRATLPCWPRSLSGGLAITACGSPGGQVVISVADLESGEVTSVATFVSGAYAEWAIIPLVE
jgi:hypothetical protein